MANYTGKGCFKKGGSGNLGGPPKLTAEVKEAFQGKAPEALAVLVRCLELSDDRIAIARAGPFRRLSMQTGAAALAL